MSRYLRLRIVPPELAEQVEQRTFLGVGTGVGRMARLVEAALITDADAPVVPSGGMCADLVDRTAAVEMAVAGDIEMIADISKSPRFMRSPQSLYREITVIARRAAMDYQEANLPIILIETPRRHSEQALMPSAPAMALATAMITLRSTPQTDFFSLFCSMIYDL